MELRELGHQRLCFWVAFLAVSEEIWLGLEDLKEKGGFELEKMNKLTKEGFHLEKMKWLLEMCFLGNRPKSEKLNLNFQGTWEVGGFREIWAHFNKTNLNSYVGPFNDWLFKIWFPCAEITEEKYPIPRNPNKHCSLEQILYNCCNNWKISTLFRNLQLTSTLIFSKIYPAKIYVFQINF